MDKLLELFESIKDESLEKDDLEDYHKQLSSLKAEMHLELAGLKKKRGMFMLRNLETPTATKEREWEGSEDGLREAELKEHIKAVGTNLSSLKSRLYNTY